MHVVAIQADAIEILYVAEDCKKNGMIDLIVWMLLSLLS